MHALVTWILICIILFIAVVVLALMAIVRRKLKLFIAATALFFVCMGCGVYTLLKAGVKVLGIATKTFALEDGEHIYERTWGKPASSCVQILEYRDATIPIMDFEICLQFKTCPDEVARILAGKEYTSKVVDARVAQTLPLAGSKSFASTPSVIYLLADTEHGREELYISADSTEVYYRNVW